MKKVFRIVTRHKKIIIPLAIILAIAAIFAITRPSAAQQVETESVKRQDLMQTLSASGSIDAMQSVDLNFLAGGKLVYLGVKKGDQVVEGEVIANLDQRTTQKTLENTLRSYSIQRNTFEQTNKDNNAKAPKDAVNDQIKRILENNQYDLEKAVISVELQELAKEQSVLISPINGIVTKADVTSAGVNVGPTTTFTISDPNSMVFKMDIDEADIGKVKEGLPVSMILDAYPDQTIDVNVDYIDFSTHTTTTGGNAFTVQANLPPQREFAYRFGMSGDAEILLNEKKDVLTVPTASLIDDTYVYVLKNNQFEKRKIKIGLSNDTETEVLSGLELGEKVALDPVAAEAVKPKKFLLF